MLVGLCGAHRSGKTTLGTAFAAQHIEFKFVATSVSDLMRSRGWNPAHDYPIEERLVMQDAILDDLDRLYASCEPFTVVDRTPLDAAAYLLADVQRTNVSPANQRKIVAYVNRAFQITNRRFGLIVFVPSVLPLVHAEGKAPAEEGYVEHISILINGMKTDHRMKSRHFMLRRGCIDLAARVKAMDSCTKQVFDQLGKEVDEVNASGFGAH